MSRILVCGDAMTDRYWFGDVERISPEAPVPVVKMRHVEDRFGAAENVVRNIEALEGECEWLFSPDSERILKVRLIGKQQQIARVDFDYPQKPIDIEAFMKYSARCSVIVFSDYNKGSLSNVDKLIANCPEGKIILVDPKSYDYEKYCGADVIKPNVDEMRAMVGGWKSEDDLENKAQKLRLNSQIGALLLTRASGGMSLYSDDGVHHIKSMAKEVYDVTGAGDTVMAALAVMLSQGKSLKEAATIANYAAGIVVGKFGTATVTMQEIEEAMREAH